MMADDLEQRIRERAYEIWENEGCPEGRGDEHWQQACAEYRDAQAEAEAQAGVQAGADAGPTDASQSPWGGEADSPTGGGGTGGSTSEGMDDGTAAADRAG